MNTNLKKIFATLAFGFGSLTLSFGQTADEGFGYLYSEEPEKAKDVFTKMAESSPSVDNYYNLGYYYLRTDKLDEAKAAFDKGLAIDDRSYLNQVGLAAVELGKGNRDKAKEMIDYAEKKTRGKDAQVLYRAGEAYSMFEKNSDYSEALRLLDEATKRDPKLADAYITKGDILSKQNEGGKAVTAYEYALTARPNWALANNRIGQIYLRGKNYNLALDFFKKAIEQNSDFAPAYRDLAELYYLARQYKLAASNYDTYVQKSGTKDPRTVLRAAQFAFAADDYARSLELLKTIDGKLDDNILKRMYGWSYYKTNDMENSIKNLEEFIKIAPEKVISDDYKYLGRAYNKMATEGEYTDQGMDYLMKGAEMDTSNADAAVTYKEIANSYYKNKNYVKAAQAYTKGIGLDTATASANDYFQQGLSYFQGASNITVPDTAGKALSQEDMAKMDEAYASLDSAGLSKAKKDLYLQADSTFAKGTVKLPEWPYNYYWRGSALYNAYNRQENIDKGISAPYYEKFATLAEADQTGANFTPYLKLVYGYLGYYNQSTVKDMAKAKTYYEKLVAIDPENSQAIEFLQMTNNPGAASDTGATGAPTGTAVKKNK